MSGSRTKERDARIWGNSDRRICVLVHSILIVQLIINGLIVVSFCGKEEDVDLNGFHVSKRREIANNGLGA
ncbi:hypothetical protein J15TS10_40500 [Paenibacillus woosongensis]|uniref:Transmembrane protein n=1 Tax=Paenibacillus woosongensis TaxID=307580 RepID=A0ABQ4MWG1_9BACL|nr:hypothetical protein J15TS10_40500 [Paenibacillus woosongensis]